ncbi:hypothetical protein FAM22279_00204 [Lacticaseibacillus paracasei]|nr:hypothetical protein FAM22279_00204 [Lacticaseibacillus paracasei]
MVQYFLRHITFALPFLIGLTVLTFDGNSLPFTGRLWLHNGNMNMNVVCVAVNGSRPNSGMCHTHFAGEVVHGDPGSVPQLGFIQLFGLRIVDIVFS